MNFTYKERLYRFCEKYLIKVLDDSKRRPIFAKDNYFVDPSNKTVIEKQQVVSTEQVVTLEIPLTKLNAIADVEAIYYNQVSEIGIRRTFEAWMGQQEEEAYLRSKYPAVQEAFERYSLMLNLCRERPKTFPDNT